MAERLIPVLRRNLMAALRRGELDEAATLLGRLQEADRLALETRTLELELLVRRRRSREAAALAAQLAELFPASARLRHWAGRAVYQVRDYEGAVAHLRESRRLAPHWTNDWWLGKALTQRGDLDEAEALLAPLVAERPWVALDLAWLHERRGDPARALRLVEERLRADPDDGRARDQRLRLRARLASPDELRAEVAGLVDLGEEVPEALVPEYVESLLRTGRGAEARAFVRERRAGLGARTACALAWKAHRLLAFDLSFALLADQLEGHLEDPKHLNALERAARRAGRVPDLIERYAGLADRHRPLYGRIRRLQRAAGG